MRIVGYKKCSGKTESGSEYSGKRIFFIFEDDHTVGVETDKCFLSDSKLKDIDLDSLIKNKTNVRLLYNKYGRADSIEVLR